MPQTAGARVHTDRRDARPRARLRRAGDLTPGSVPALDEDALRARRWAREETRRDLQAATRRLNAFWLRHDRRSTGRAHGRPAPRRWPSAGGWPTPAPPLVCQADGQTVTAQPARRGRLERARHEPGNTGRFAPGVEALQARRGVQVTGAVTTVAERGDRTRVEHPRPLLHERGRTPAASARGGRRQQGGMTQTGHTPARRARVEGAGASRYPATVRRPRPRRLATRPTALQALRWQAQGRLCQRSRQRMATGQQAQQVVGAIARDLSAFRWAMAPPVAGAPNASRGRGVDAPVQGFHPCSADTPPRCGVPRGGVMRPTGPLGPSLRPAPDGCQSGGSQPPASRVINRRV